ncbi:MAG: hypothetical protein K2R98_12295 [Gemmataceae bacterium]|nr:hypothetical protein [Gemmataceae bacterium]
MPFELLDRLQEDKLQGLEALIDSYENATAASSGADDEGAAVADFFVDEGIGVRQSSLRLWDHHWTRALAGKIPDRQERGAMLLALLERGGHLIRRGAAIARAYADLSGNEVARLAQFEEQSRTFPLWVKECRARWEMLERPHKPLKRERITESQAAYERGEGELVSDVIARLEQGGPLVKD